MLRMAPRKKEPSGSCLTERTGSSKAQINRDIANGLFPSAVKLGPKARAWPEEEIADLMAAKAGGATEAELRELVGSMEAARKERARAVLERHKRA
jgi:predicted DNA-binding transcriptional regulator AlpA